MDEEIKTLGLHLCATCRELSAARFDSIYLRPSYYYYVYPTVSYLEDNVLGVISDLIEVKVGLLSENVLIGCIVTESKCSRITQQFHTARRRPILNHKIV